MDMTNSVCVRRTCRGLLAGLLAGALAAPAAADPAPPAAPPAPDVAPVAAPTAPRVFTRQAAVLWTLQNNPELMALRQQHGIAAAAIVIAETYPFNPVWESRVRYATGPESAAVTNVVPTENSVMLEVECRGQGGYRRQEASAALARTDWDIANQELTFAVRAVRAFNAILYRQRKIELIRDNLTLTEQAAEQIRRLLGTKFHAADQIQIQTELADVRSQLPPGRLALESARYDLRRLLGVLAEDVLLTGELTPLPGELDSVRLTQAALAQRPDLRGRQSAVAEAQARLRLEVANRLGNVTVGPNFEQDPTNISMVGVQFLVPLPVLNTHRGLVEQRQAERVRATLDLRQTEVLVQQDVQAALARLQNARAWLDTYQKEVRPSLERNLDAIRKLWLEGEPGVDVLRVIDVQRKLLRARDAELDALFEVTQAEADLAAAVGDPALVVGPCPAPPPEEPPPPRNP
jgi:outer membrane protein TolC